MRLLISLLTCVTLGGCSGVYYRAINVGVDNARVTSEKVDVEDVE